MKTRKRERLINFLLYGVFALYLLLLFLILFRQHHDVRSVNLIPFRSIFSYLTGRDLISGTADPVFLRGFAFSNLLGNVVIFIPLGIYAVLFHSDKSVWKNALRVVLTSVAAEAAQVIFQMGVGDIDDVILNGLGGLLGVLLCKGLYRLCRNEGLKVRCAVALAAPAAGILSIVSLILMNR